MKGEPKQILSVSRRTDIPAFYMDWFMDQVARGFIDVINPFNRQIKRVAVSPERVHAMVFWSKNFDPFLTGRYGERLQAMGYHLLFNFTVNSHSPILEPGVPDLNQSLAAGLSVDRSGSFAIGSEARRSNGASTPSATSPRKQAPSRPISMISKPSQQQQGHVESAPAPPASWTTIGKLSDEPGAG